MKNLNYISDVQWAKYVALITISAVMLYAASAQAYFYPIYYADPHPNAETISHCGVLPTSAKRYTKRPRNVRIIQRKLAQMGYDIGRSGVDGRFGPKTRAALAAFQGDNYTTTRGDRRGYAGGATMASLAYSAHAIPNVRRCQRYSPARIR